MALNGEQCRKLFEAFSEAFHGDGELKHLVRFSLDRHLHQITGGSTQHDRILDLIDWADSHGMLEPLFKGALAMNAGNPKLRAVIAEITQPGSGVNGSAVLAAVPFAGGPTINAGPPPGAEAGRAAAPVQPADTVRPPSGTGSVAPELFYVGTNWVDQYGVQWYRNAGNLWFDLRQPGVAVSPPAYATPTCHRYVDRSWRWYAQTHAGWFIYNPSQGWVPYR